MTGLFLARHANNFLSARKAGQGGWGQINNALKSLLQEIVVFFNGGLFMACIMSCCLTLDSPTLTYSSRPCSNLTLPRGGLSLYSYLFADQMIFIKKRVGATRSRCEA